jgi:hypothetical protein
MNQRPNPREMGVLTSQTHAHIYRSSSDLGVVQSRTDERERRGGSERDKTLPRRRPPRAAGDPASQDVSEVVLPRPPRPGGDPDRWSRPRSRVGARCPPPPPPAQGFGGAGSRIAEVCIPGSTPPYLHA